MRVCIVLHCSVMCVCACVCLLCMSHVVVVGKVEVAVCFCARNVPLAHVKQKSTLSIIGKINELRIIESKTGSSHTSIVPRLKKAKKLKFEKKKKKNHKKIACTPQMQHKRGKQKKNCIADLPVANSSVVPSGSGHLAQKRVRCT